MIGSSWKTLFASVEIWGSPPSPSFFSSPLAEAVCAATSACSALLTFGAIIVPTSQPPPAPRRVSASSPAAMISMADFAFGLPSVSSASAMVIRP
ncbi:hypothetical protein AJ87_06375 [Rhizobium yanglingense]|nr:hypothetical protein AJ87_06375 [Rhizobium yanglingense]